MSKGLFYVGAVMVVVGISMPSGETDGEASTSAYRAEAVASGSREPVVTRIRRQRNGHFYVHATVNGQLVHFLVDTGATTIALTTEDAARVGEKVASGSFDIVGEGAGGPVRGARMTLDSVEIEGKRVENVRAVVLDGLSQSLLGQNYLSRMGSVEMTADEMVIRPRGARRS